MSDPKRISGLDPNVIANLAEAVAAAKNERCRATYFAVKANKTDAARKLGLEQEGNLWFIRTENSYAIGQKNKSWAAMSLRRLQTMICRPMIA